MPGNKKRSYSKRVKRDYRKHIIVGKDFDKKPSDVKKYLLISLLAVLVILTTIASLNFNSVKSWFSAPGGKTTNISANALSDPFVEYRFVSLSNTDPDYIPFTETQPRVELKDSTVENYIGDFQTRVCVNGKTPVKLRVKCNESILFYEDPSDPTSQEIVAPNLGFSISYTLASGWVDGEDGYYYYGTKSGSPAVVEPTIVYPAQSTTYIPLFTAGAITDTNSVISTDDLQMRLDIAVEAVQIGRDFDDFHIPPTP